jgi:hypothetical protein
MKKLIVVCIIITFLPVLLMAETTGTEADVSTDAGAAKKEIIEIVTPAMGYSQFFHQGIRLRKKADMLTVLSIDKEMSDEYERLHARYIGWRAGMVLSSIGFLLTVAPASVGLGILLSSAIVTPLSQADTISAATLTITAVVFLIPAIVMSAVSQVKARKTMGEIVNLINRFNEKMSFGPADSSVRFAFTPDLRLDERGLASVGPSLSIKW